MTYAYSSKWEGVRHVQFSLSSHPFTKKEASHAKLYDSGCIVNSNW